MLASHWRWVCLAGFLAGCGQAGTTPVASTPEPNPSAEIALGEAAPAVSLGMAEEPAPPEEAPPEPGTPRWLLMEIQRLRLAPLPTIGDETPENADGVQQTAASSPADIQAQLAKTRAVRRERNEEIVKLATEAIALTAKDAKQQDEFYAAVGQLLDARLQLALQGDEDSIAALYDAADAFHQKKPNTPADAAAQLTLVNLSHALAMRYGKSEPRWLTEFSHQAQLFATRFPTEQDRSLPLLLAAGKSCELNGLTEEAVSCYGLIPAKFPDSPQAKQSEAILRRLTLAGTALEFAGPTLDGNFVSVEDYAGKAVVIIFWASHVTAFREQAPTLQAVAKKYEKYAQVLSVSLDDEESQVDAFLEETKLTWPVIFHVEPAKRGWNSPLAAHYGITQLPTIWLVDPQGKVVETQVSAEDLQPKLHELLLRYLNREAKAGEKTPTGSQSVSPQ